MRQVLMAAMLVMVATSCTLLGDSADRRPVPNTNCTAAPSPEPDDSGIYLPTYCPMDARPLAEIRGRLVVDDGCLWLDQRGGRRLPLWPPGTSIEEDGSDLVVIDSDGVRTVVGTDVVATGGEYGGEGKYDLVVDTIGEEIPAACRGTDDQYDLVYDVRAADR
jgi:hypothetical protein